MSVADVVLTKNVDTKKAHLLDKIEKLKMEISMGLSEPIC